MIQAKEEGNELEFEQLLQVLGLHVVGSHGLPYPEMLV